MSVAPVQLILWPIGNTWGQSCWFRRCASVWPRYRNEIQFLIAVRGACRWLSAFWPDWQISDTRHGWRSAAYPASCRYCWWVRSDLAFKLFSPSRQRSDRAQPSHFSSKSRPATVRFRGQNRPSHRDIHVNCQQTKSQARLAPVGTPSGRRSGSSDRRTSGRPDDSGPYARASNCDPTGRREYRN